MLNSDKVANEFAQLQMRIHKSDKKARDLVERESDDKNAACATVGKYLSSGRI